MRELKCFIASAFEKKDVDLIYEKVVQPVLRKKSIIPLRVDRVEHNDDIDDKILALIKECDFCIADLSYARPSVYYEAGRVHGMGKPVIFLARSDHFKHRENDELGNFRIHFDLQMKNIIKWAEPTATLKKQLESRINIISNPLLKVLSENEIIKESQATFSKLSQKEKFLKIVQPIENELIKMKFQLEEKSSYHRDNVLAIKKMSRSSILVWCLAEASFTKKRLMEIRSINQINSWSFLSFFKKMNINTKKNITFHILCLSLRSIPDSRIEDALPHFFRQEKSGIYSYFRKSNSSYDSFNSIHIHFLDKIDSALSVQEKLKEHLPLIGKLDNQNINSF